VPLAALSIALGAADAAAPPVVDWRAAGERIGQVVTVEGDVRDAQCAEDRCILEFAPDDPGGFRVVVLMPMFTRATPAPDETFRGRRIRATGKLQRFQGRVEMVLRGTGQIELADAPATESTVVTPSTTRPSTPPPSASPTTVPPVAPSASLPPAAPHGGATPSPPSAPAVPAQQPLATTPSSAPTRVEAPPPPLPRDDAPARARVSCEQAKARWRETASDVRTHTVALERCFRALPYRCHPESTALAAALPLLDEAERQVEETCR
jgi:hypothetical protein